MNNIYAITEFDKVREYLAENAIGSPGNELCKTLTPYDNVDKIKTELSLTTKAMELLRLNKLPPLEHFTDMKSSIDYAKRKLSLSADEIFDFGIVLKMSGDVKNYLENNTDEEFSFIKTSLYADRELEAKIFKVFDAHGEIKNNATPELKRLYKSLEDLEENIKKAVSRLMYDETFKEYLQDNVFTMRNGRTVFGVKAENKNKIDGIVHDVSASGRTFFIEPKELTELHNREAETKSMINAEKERILKVFSNDISNISTELENDISALAQVDFIFAKAKYASKTGAIAAKIAQSPKIILKSMKNPVLMRVCDKIVENDFSMKPENSVIIVTGSNTGGKTVILKTVGLFVLMTKAGMPVPCFDAEIYPFEKVFADLGDEQSIIQSLSTFSAHLKNISKMTENADDKTLVLIDEICAGTDPAEGAALAKSILKFFRDKKTFCLITTHFGELKTFALNEQNFQNASVRFDNETLKPSYVFTAGIPGSSNALAVAKNLGLNSSVVDEAHKFLNAEETEIIKKSKELEFLYQQTLKNFEISNFEKRNIKTLKQNLEKQNEKLKTEKKKIIEIFSKRLESELGAVKDEIKDILEELRADESEKNALKSSNKAAYAGKKFKKVLSDEKDALKEKYTSPDFSKLKQGDTILVKDLDVPGIFQNFSSGGKKAVVTMGDITTNLPLSKIAVWNNSLKSSQPKKLKFSHKMPVFRQHEVSTRLDLRGDTVDEALYDLEKFLDSAAKAGIFSVTVIHGHGTGALRKNVREYLKTSPYVAKFRPGEPSEGGDGVVVVDLD